MSSLHKVMQQTVEESLGVKLAPGTNLGVRRALNTYALDPAANQLDDVPIGKTPTVDQLRAMKAHLQAGVDLCQAAILLLRTK